MTATGYVATKDNQALEFADGATVSRVNLIDYIAAMVIPVGAGERIPIFTAWTSPACRTPRATGERERVLARVSDYSVSPAVGWTWVIASVAASHAEAVLELTYRGRDHVFGGPWLRDGFDLENPILVGPRLVIDGWLDRRRCGPGAINVWLRGFLYCTGAIDERNKLGGHASPQGRRRSLRSATDPR